MFFESKKGFRFLRI